MQELSLYPDRAAFVPNARPGRRFPVFAEIPLDGRSVVDLYRSIRGERYGFVLESGKGGRYSYISTAFDRIFKSHGRDCQLDGEPVHGDPFDILSSLLGQEPTIPNDRLSRFAGGAVGYLAYDMARHIERLPSIAVDDLRLPESYFLFTDHFYEIDHERSVVRAVVSRRLDERSAGEQYDSIARSIAQMIAAIGPTPAEHETRQIAPRRVDEASLSPEEFERIVERAREYIFAGDIFQVNLSVRFARSLEVDPLLLYEELRRINPSPYMSYFDLPELAIVSASPEQLLRVEGRTVETRPIAGTRARGRNEEEDLANAKELIENEKERAEHLMLVDLERNDLGRVARYGSVEVNEFMAIEKYSHVIHIVSNVRAELAENRTGFDAIRATFPGGTITGAPKVRSMEIIEELEPTRRGLYTGSIGWIGYNGDLELNIAIRTIVVVDGVAYVQAGAGIVADSVPSREYKESRRKAEAGLQAIERIAHATINGHGE